MRKLRKGDIVINGGRACKIVHERHFINSRKSLYATGCGESINPDETVVLITYKVTCLGCLCHADDRSERR